MVLLLLFQFAGEGLSALFSLPVPGNVMGMALMLLGLFFGLVKEAWLEEASELLLSHMAMFFVPAGVGVMLYLELIGREWVPITAGTLISTFVVMAATGWTEKLLDRNRDYNS
jgi:holin-like protein